MATRSKTRLVRSSKSSRNGSNGAAPKAKAKSTGKAAKYVYYWADGKADGDGKMKALLGGKGANLHEMTRIGLPVPAGFTITTEVCTYFYANKRTYPAALQAQIAEGV